MFVQYKQTNPGNGIDGSCYKQWVYDFSNVRLNNRNSDGFR